MPAAGSGPLNTSPGRKPRVGDLARSNAAGPRRRLGWLGAADFPGLAPRASIKERHEKHAGSTCVRADLYSCLDGRARRNVDPEVDAAGQEARATTCRAEPRISEAGTDRSQVPPPDEGPAAGPLLGRNRRSRSSNTPNS